MLSQAHATVPPCIGSMAVRLSEALLTIRRCFVQAKVAVLGAAGGIGQPLALLLKSSNLIGELSLYDVANTAGVACDLSHISTAVRVKAYTGPNQLQDALRGCQLVVIPAGWFAIGQAGPCPLKCL